jgi:hypothetical protein
MRAAVLLSFLLLAGVASGCHQQPRPAASSSVFVEQHFAGRFQNVASGAQLGAPWLAAGGAGGVQAVYAAHSGTGALLVLHGEGVPALWLGGSAATAALPLKLEHPPLYADVDQHLAYAAIPASSGNGPQLVRRDLAVADAQWQTVLTAQAPGWVADQLYAVKAHPASPKLWLVGTIGSLAAGQEAAPPLAEPAPLDQHPPATPEADAYGSVTLCRLDANAAPLALTELLPVRDLDTLELAPLADGRALLHADSVLYIADPDAADQIVKIHKDEDPLEFQIFADLDEPTVAWLYYPPQSTDEGTNRAGEEFTPGYVVAIDTTGTELSRLEVGAVPFSQFVGEWRKRRCFLAASSSGVVLADLAKQQLSWLLRQGGEVPLYLLPAARQLWAAVPDGIVGIGLDDLVKLAPGLSAAQALSKEQIAELKPAVEALGWDWPATQLSPLMAQTGRLTLFDTADASASFAEFDWSMSAQHASRLLIARAPQDDDLAMLGQDMSEVDQYCRGLLATLGWSAAVRDETRGTQSPSELQVIYQLQPELKAPLSPGEFELWINDQAVTMSLTAATSGFPAGVVSLEDARRNAADAVSAKLQAAGESTGGMEIGNAVSAGWLVLANAAADSLSPEQLPESVPALRLEVLVGTVPLGQTAPPRLFVVMLDAVTGQQLAITEHSYSASVELRRAHGEFAAWGAPPPALGAAAPGAVPPPQAAPPPPQPATPPSPAAGT